ncbi:MAG: hypothetical protein IJ219_03305 [Bacteroidaceae bacterium]|nr:hypothetical protein [Bacteroidaceae bacterium]
MLDRLKQLEKLDRVTEAEWREALSALTAWIAWRLRGKTSYGAHSEEELGMPAADYYIGEAVMRLFECRWEWQDRFSLKDQLIRMVGSLIDTQLKAYQLKVEEGRCSTGEVDASTLSDSLPDDDYTLDVAYEIAQAKVKGDNELESFLDAIRTFNDFKAISSHLNITIDQVYNLQKRLMRRLGK